MFSMREIFLCASLGCGVGGDAQAVKKQKTKKQAVPSSELLIWPLKKTSPLGLSCHLFA